MTTVAMLWRLGGGDQRLPAESVAATLRGFEFVTHVTTERDEGGDLLVGLFGRSSDAKTVIDSTKAAMATATENFGHVLAKMEWAGIVRPEPDPTKPDSFPAIPTAESLKRRRQGQSTPGPAATNYRVAVRVSGRDLGSRSSVSATLFETMRAMQRIRRPRVTVDPPTESVLLEFEVVGSNADSARIAALNATEAVLSASMGSEVECEMKVVSVRPAETTG